MAVLSKIPRTDVSVADIRDTLNANGGSVTNVVGTFFSSAANINIWARQKPIHWKSDTSNNDGAGDGNYGFTPATAASIASLKSLYSNELNGWVFNPPTGGSSSPFRLGDFRNYNPSARESSFGVSTPITTSLTARVYAPIIESDDRSTLLLSDFDAIKNGYFGIALFRKDNGNLTYWQTNTEKGTLSVTINTTFTQMEYIAMPFISSVPYTLNETFKSAIYYSIPIGSLTLVSATSIAAQYKLSIKGEKTGGNIFYTVTSTETSITREGIFVDCRFNSSQQGDTFLSGESRSSTFSLAAGKSHSGRFTVVDTKAYRLDLYCGSIYIKSVVPIESSLG